MWRNRIDFPGNSLWAVVVFALLLIVGMQVLGDWSAEGAEEPRRGGRLVFAESQDIYSPAPYIYGPNAVNLSVYNSLFRPDKSGDLQSDLAAAYTLVNPTTYVVKIRNGVKFHDGKPVTAEDVKFSFEYLMRPATGATRGPVLAALLDGIDVVDPLTVRFRLKRPASVFISVLGLPDVPIISKTWVEAGGDYRKDFNGTGPFKMASFVRGEKYLMRRNESYFKPGLPYLDEIEMRVVLDDETRVHAVRAGDADILSIMPWQQAASSGLRLEKGWAFFNAMVFNPNKKPWNDKRVREAVNYAIDRASVNTLAHGGFGMPITGGLFHKGSKWNCGELEGFYTYDPAKAKALLAAAGYPNGFTMNMVLPQFGPYVDAWGVVGDNLKNVGITSNVIPTDLGGNAELRVNGKYEALFTGTGVIYDDPDALSVFYESSGAFYGHAHNFKDTTVDDLFQRGRTISGFADRKKMYCDLQRHALEEAWWAFITWRPNLFGMKPAVRGFVSLPGFYVQYSQFTLEETWLNR